VEREIGARNWLGNTGHVRLLHQLKEGFVEFILFFGGR
jgi:hypothetical protein